MQESLYEANCGRCVHVKRSLQQGTACGITGAKPVLQGNCPHLVIDPEAEKEYAIRDARRQRVAQLDDEMGVEEFKTILDQASLKDTRGNVRWRGIFGGILVVLAILWKIFHFKTTG